MKVVTEDQAVEALSVVADVLAMEQPSQDDLATAAQAQRVIDRFVGQKEREAMARWQGAAGPSETSFVPPASSE